jgi:hypothetical protein
MLGSVGDWQIASLTDELLEIPARWGCLTAEPLELWSPPVAPR